MVSIGCMDLAPASTSRLSTRAQTRLSRLVARPTFWAVVILVGFGIPIANQVLRPARDPLPTLGTLSAFELVDQRGRTFGSADLEGKVWVASFIFTRCPTICPNISGLLQGMQKRARGLGSNFHIVSFSVDPNYDKPDVLAAYAERFTASPRTWHFLTGPLDVVQDTVEGGLKMAMGPIEGDQDFASIMHGTHLVLVDKNLTIRGYYDSSDPNVTDELLADATMLINRGY